MIDKIKILTDFENTEWITKSGKKKKIKDLELSHLENIVNYLEKRFNELENPMNDYPSFQGEMAQMYAEREWEESVKYYENLKNRINLFRAYYYLKSL